MAKMQWNTMNKESRETLGNFYVAVMELADKKALYSKAHKARKTILDTDRANLDKLNRGEATGVISTKEELEANIHKWESDIKKYFDAEKSLEKEIRTRMERAYTLVSDEQHVAYEKRTTDMATYDAHLKTFCQKVGVTPTDTGLRILASLVGEKEVNGKAVVKNPENAGLSTDKKDVYTRKFLKGVCREMLKAGVLRTDMYAFEFQLEEKKN